MLTIQSIGKKEKYITILIDGKNEIGLIGQFNVLKADASEEANKTKVIAAEESKE